MSESATKHDLDLAVGVLREEIAVVRGEIAVLRGDLDQAVGVFHAKLNAVEDRLRSEMRAMEDRIRGDLGSEMRAMEDRLIREVNAAVGRAAQAMMEHVQSLISIVEEKYQDLPALYGKLRTDFETHAAARHLHRRPAAAPPRRARRTRSR